MNIQQKIKDYTNHLGEIYKEFQSSKTKLYVILKYRQIFSGFFAGVAIVFGTLGFMLQGKHIFGALLSTFGFFSLNFPSLPPLDGFISFLATLSIFVGALGAILSISFLAIIFFLKDFIERYHISRVVSKEHTLVFGLGEINRSYLNSVDEKHSNILIVEQDPTNKYIDDYKEKGFAVLIGDALGEFVQERLNYATCQNIIIALGADRHNIEFTKKILQKYNDPSEVKIVVHIQNKDLEILFHTNFIEQEKKQINIKTFSFYEEVAKHLFVNHFVDGDTREYITTNKPFKTVVLADGILLEKILFHIALISHLPKQNLHTVYIVDKNAKKLMKKIQKALYYRREKESFPHLEIVPLELDRETLEFYTDSLWYEESLVNVIIGYDDEKENLDLAVELYNRVYLQQAVDEVKMPKILFGVFDEMLLSKIVNENKKNFKNFFTYGNVNDILGHKHLIDEEGDLLGKLVHYTYDGFLDEKEKNYVQDKLVHYKTDKTMRDAINKSWYKSSTYSDKLSSIAQAKLIDLKLKALNLTKKESTLPIEELLKRNREVFDPKIDETFEGAFVFSKDFDSTLFRNLIRMEHNRWNAYHYLNGFRYSKQKDKEKKLHDCLLPIEEFNTKKIQDTIVYDIYSFMYIPNYLAEVGYEIVEA